jgi:hypothetical protein
VCARHKKNNSQAWLLDACAVDSKVGTVILVKRSDEFFAPTVVCIGGPHVLPPIDPLKAMHHHTILDRDAVACLDRGRAPSTSAVCAVPHDRVGRFWFTERGFEGLGVFGKKRPHDGVTPVG